MNSRTDPDLRQLLVVLNRNPAARARIPALPDRTVVYSGGVASVQGVFAAWKQLAQAKAQDPRKFDYVTLEERLRSLHVIEFGETSFDYANRASTVRDLRARRNRSGTRADPACGECRSVRVRADRS
jgi:hypothetical protein